MYFHAMSISITKRITEHSDWENFVFSFYCNRCGKEWRSNPIPFTSGGFTSIVHDETRKLIWAQEHRAAFDRANLEAHLQFNNCSLCNEWVCDDCFCIDKDGKGVCLDCL